MGGPCVKYSRWSCSYIPRVAMYVNCVTPSHIVTRLRLVYVDVDVDAEITRTRDETATNIQKNNQVGPVVSVLLAPEQLIRPTVDMSASNAPRVFPSHELLMPLVPQKVRHGLLCHCYVTA
ncbi:hypothetical protein HID58_018996 [Brassica napus]|uniref:Uncharacterized protein n=1 Tax=Brassica napus TaxID=3708 RepID=A0ABQ8DE60_BRANA|nr:hypothetical protein HID58_018996 [Brassica napus]